MLREEKRVGSRQGEEVLSAECWEKRRISWQLAREEESWQLAVGSWQGREVLVVLRDPSLWSG